MSTSPHPLIRRLTSVTGDGKPYERSPFVDDEIGRKLMQHHSRWLEDDPQNETLIHLIREIRKTDLELLGLLSNELSRRTSRMAAPWVKSFDETTTLEILYRIEREIFALVLADTTTTQTEFLEVAFVKAVQCRTRDIVEKYKHLRRKNRVQIGADSAFDDNDETRAVTWVRDHRPDPEASFLEMEKVALQPELIRKAYAEVEDPLDLEVAVLHFRDGIPIRSKDPSVEDLVTITGQSEGKVKYRLARAMKAMRQACGVEI